MEALGGRGGIPEVVYSKENPEPITELAIGKGSPKGCGFKTRPRRCIFKGDKNPQHTFLSDGK
jgi:hypothetical protein